MYKIKEPFQNTTSDTNVTVIPNAPLSVEEAQVHINTLEPLIVANPEMQGVFNSDKGIDLSQIDFAKAKKLSSTPSVNTTVPDTRPITDIGRQCDVAKNELASIKSDIAAYKASNSWVQARALKRSIAPLQEYITSLGC